MAADVTSICECGCPKQWHYGSKCLGHCTECNCEVYELHHLESYGNRRSHIKLYVGIRNRI